MNLKLVIFNSLYRSNCYFRSRIPHDNYSKNVIFTRTQRSHVNFLIHCNQRVLFSSTTFANSKNEENISKTRQRVFQHFEEFKKLQQERKVDYNIGVRHLANIMGEDPENFTQDDVDRAISYLMPSGLYQVTARPMMKPPDEVFRTEKSLAFDISGRPFHSLYYTGRPNYYSLLQEISLKAEHFDNLLDAKDKTPEASISYFANSSWIKKENFERIILEKVNDDLFRHFIRSMERLIHHPLAHTERDFFMKYRHETFVPKPSEKQYEILYTKDDIPYVTVNSQRKNAIATVTVYARGTGRFTVNGQDILYFENHGDRRQIMFPLQLADVMQTVDVEATAENGGQSSQAGAVKLGIASGLVPFLPQIMVDKLRLAGLLTVDKRKAERQKPGKLGARKSYKWKKR